MLSIILLALLITSLVFGSLFMFRSKSMSEGSRMVFIAANLMFALYSALMLVAPAFAQSKELQETVFIFKNLSFYAAIPLISALIIVEYLLDIRWSKQAWGRLFLGLCAVYIIFDRLHVLNIQYYFYACLAINAIMVIKLAQRKKISESINVLAASGLLYYLS